MSLDTPNDLRTEMEARLETLKSEYEAGQTQIAALEARLSELRNTVLRISGAIQVLEEIGGPQPMLTDPKA